jgi:hypothetical protein
MSQAVLVSPAPISTSDDMAEPLPADAGFDGRWAAWQARGGSHERITRRRFFMLAPVAAVVAAIVYLLLSR